MRSPTTPAQTAVAAVSAATVLMCLFTLGHLIAGELLEWPPHPFLGFPWPDALMAACGLFALAGHGAERWRNRELRAARRR